ncbi:polysaccharide deacetylase family protein [Streptomyces sp. TRM43335]|uniref:Polysaccharide deacetylase family protein n=1 Tax=Streptomyces taklimakanensis TaxID=2569853 RepID=A0A6G2B905_9ACTN|nr:polysaccharide deacetylase family protein [Streptomyces taklimakanensis]MTE18747.1 polysaccharide deacetylase family protein [Streptomyces taklimakanensis]
MTARKTQRATGSRPRPRRAGRRLRRLVTPLLLCAGLCLGTAGTAGTAQAVDSTVVTSTQSGGRTVSFTFDDGPDPTHTPNLLAVLRKHNVKATFCLWGDRVRQYPHLVRQIAADGHRLCNHTMSHQDLGGWSQWQVRQNLEQTDNVIRQAAPGARITYFRAPYGSWGQSPQVAASMGMQPLGWRMDIGDWQPPGTAELVRRITQGVTPGAVVLMHDGGGDRSQTVAAVDQTIPQLKSQGYTFDQPAVR